MQLTTAQIDLFQQEGYLILPNFFNRHEVEAMQQELTRFYQQDLGRNVATDGDGKTHSTRLHNYQVIPLNTISDLYRALPYCPKVKTVVSQLIGDPFIRHLDQIFLKPPQTGIGTNWHTDNGYFRISDPTKGTGMWIALHDASVENGTLHLVPGGHKQTHEHTRDLSSDHHITCQPDESQALPIEMEAGGIAFFNYGIPHCTKENNTDKPRGGCAYHFLRQDYIPEGAQQMHRLPVVTGPDATGGEREYGQRIEGTWDAEVDRLIG